MFDLLTAIPPDRLAAFIAGGLILNLTPGADVMFATACGLSGGPRAGACAGLGVGLGAVWHIALAAAGLSALIAAHPGALVAIRWAGAGYLLWLAWKSWHAGAAQAGTGAARGWQAFRRGALTNALNPKPALFMLAFLPQFVTPGAGPVWQQIVVLGLIFAATGTMITAAYGALAGWAGRFVSSRLAILNRVAAVLFAGLAVRVAAG